MCITVKWEFLLKKIFFYIFDFCNNFFYLMIVKDIKSKRKNLIKNLLWLQKQF